MRAHLGFDHELIEIALPSDNFGGESRELWLESIMKKGTRLESGEGRAWKNLELEGLGFVLENWQNS